MTDKTAEQAAEEYEKLVHMSDFKELNPADIESYLALDRRHAFLAGDVNGAERERNRIWEAVERLKPTDIKGSIFAISIHSDVLAEIIFGGGDVE